MEITKKTIELVTDLRRATATVMFEMLIAEIAHDYDVEPEKILKEIKANTRSFVGSMKVLNNVLDTISSLEKVNRNTFLDMIDEETRARGWEAYKDENRYKGDVR